MLKMVLQWQIALTLSVSVKTYVPTHMKYY